MKYIITFNEYSSMRYAMLLCYKIRETTTLIVGRLMDFVVSPLYSQLWKDIAVHPNCVDQMWRRIYYFKKPSSCYFYIKTPFSFFVEVTSYISQLQLFLLNLITAYLLEQENATCNISNQPVYSIYQTFTTDCTTWNNIPVASSEMFWSQVNDIGNLWWR
jgi:hypothetical protein